MATGFAVAVANNADLDSICDELELQLNITDASISGGIWETGAYTNVLADRGDGRIGIKITGTTDAVITTAVGAIASAADIELLTNAEAALDSET